MSDHSHVYDLIVVGGGAAGYFAAISYCELSTKPRRVLILEGQKSSLSKVKISGGGRCNITHNCFSPKDLVTHYPRGSRELLGPFHHWGPIQMLDWFEQHELDHSIEADGRIFPQKNTSQAVIDCFEGLVRNYGIEVRFQAPVKKIVRTDQFQVDAPDQSLNAKALVLATGSARGGHILAKSLGHAVTELVPSIFTFKIKDEPLNALSGLSLQRVKATLQCGKKVFSAEGPMLVTHWGLSGPCILRISAFAAKELAECRYRAELVVDLFPDMHKEVLLENLEKTQRAHPKKQVQNISPEPIPKRFWAYLVERVGLGDTAWAQLTAKQMQELVEMLKSVPFSVAGRSVYKDEFVTCGGVVNTEVDFRSMQSKKTPGLYFAGEILDVDGVTGGFNFQNAWTTARLAAKCLSSQ